MALHQANIFYHSSLLFQFRNFGERNIIMFVKSDYEDSIIQNKGRTSILTFEEILQMYNLPINFV